MTRSLSSGFADFGERHPQLALQWRLAPVQLFVQVVQRDECIPNDQDALLSVWSNGGNTFRVLPPAE
jgi:hypothetical protein